MPPKTISAPPIEIGGVAIERKEMKFTICQTLLLVQP
jgi:hypothetical protein